MRAPQNDLWPVVIRYSWAIAIATAAVATRVALSPILGSSMPFITLFFGVALSTFMLGTGPGIMTLVVGQTAIAWALLEPTTSIRVNDFGDKVGLVLATAFSLGICAVIGRLRAIQKQLTEAVQRAEKSRDEAERAVKAKEDFLSLVSHELRNPINSIALSAAGLRRGDLSPDRIERSLDRIERASKSLAKMVEGLVESTRVTVGQFRFKLIRMDLVPVVRTMIDMNRPIAAEKGVELIDRIETPSAIINGDSERLAQSVSNLLDNAIKFSAGGGRIEVVLDTLDGWVRIVVSDDGEGIDPELLPRIFEKFTQGSLSTNNDRRGLGLGLSIVKHVVEVHGGRIGVASEGKGRGSRFTISLPLLESSESLRIEHHG